MNLTWHIHAWNELSAETLYTILALRAEVFVVEQNCPYQDVDGKDFKSLHVCGYSDNGQLCAYARLVKPGVSYEEWSIGRVVTSPSVRRTRAGEALMHTCMAYLRGQNIDAVRISAQSYLHDFYAKFGFVRVSEDYLEDDIPHIEMLFSQSL
ncbi:MAG: GNAT family N-acetyltransferase [Flavobacteriales bacterium]